MGFSLDYVFIDDLTEAVDLYHFNTFLSSVYAVCTQMEGLDIM